MLLAGLLTIPNLRAEIVVQLLPVADTTLRDSVPGNNYGAAANLPVGVSANGSPRNRALFRFDLSSIPAGAVINSARLRFTVVQSGAETPPANFELHRVLSSWGEGRKSGLAATAGEATWAARFHAQTNWAVGGGLAGTDFVAAPTATALLGTNGTVSEFSSPGMLADIRYWLTNAASNAGWLLMAQGETSGTGRQVGSREHSNSPPVLEVRYSAYVIYDFARTGSNIRFSFDVVSNRTYAVEYRDDAAVGVWNTLTNIPPLPASATIHITNAIVGQRRFYRLSTPNPDFTMYNVMRVGGGVRFSFNAEPNFFYAVEIRDSMAAQWSVLTNLPLFAVNTVVHITNSAPTAQRYYRVMRE